MRLSLRIAVAFIVCNLQYTASLSVSQLSLKPLVTELPSTLQKRLSEFTSDIANNQLPRFDTFVTKTLEKQVQSFEKQFQTFEQQLQTFEKQVQNLPDIAESFQSFVNSLVTATTDKTDDTRLVYHQEIAAEIASSFVSKQFDPVPWLSNCHFQTIASVFLRDIPECNYFTSVEDSLQAMLKFFGDKQHKVVEETFWDERKKIETPDNDWFHADYKFCTNEVGERNGKGLAILLHGLESNSKSPLTRDMADAHIARGLDVVCLNFRGCSGIPNDTIGGYHLGFTDDLKFFLDKCLPQKVQEDSLPIFLSGFSLGANVMIKTLGELKEKAIDKYNIQGATAFCSPMDVEQTYPMLQIPGINREIYANSLLKGLKKRAEHQLHLHCNGDPETKVFDYEAAVNAETISDFDEAFIAPIYGFDGFIDYYRKVSSTYYMEKVAVPLLILNAQDDPFFAPHDFPIEKSCEHGGRAPAKMIHCENGGHCGFTFHRLRKGEERPRNSWAPAEMGRFVQHVMNKREYYEREFNVKNVQQDKKYWSLPKIESFSPKELYHSMLGL